MIVWLTFLATVDLVMIFINAAVVYTIREDKKELVRLHGEIKKELGAIETRLDNIDSNYFDLRALMGEYGTLTKSNNKSIEEIFRILH